MSIFKIASAQYPITQHTEFSAWEKHISDWVKQAVAENAKILVFPEYGSMELTSLFPQNIRHDLQLQISEIGKHMDLFQKLYSRLAREYQVYILAPSIPFQQKDQFINRAFFFNPQGEMKYQDKLTMTRFEDEDWKISSGDLELFVFETSYGKFGINICFDSEFPQYAFELAQAGAQVLLAPSCTETQAGLSRVHIGCRARALENQMYVVVSSTIGDATWSPAVDYNTGQAAVFAPADKGFPNDGIIKIGELNRPSWLVAEIDLQKIETVRKSGQVFNYLKSTNSMQSNSQIKITTIKF